MQAATSQTEAAQVARRGGRPDIETQLPARTGQIASLRWIVSFRTAAVVIALLMTVAVVYAFSSRGAVAPARSGLSPQQIFVRGEVADRLAAESQLGLSPQQIFVRGEVADRYAH